jgi:hypothetical protein
MSAVPAFKAFLSHRYKSADVNEYFFEVFAERAGVAFEVDAANGPTNVTRLERMMRSSNGFIGIYPFVSDRADRPTRAELLGASSYFRLELGLAWRAHKPMLVYADRRFGATLEAPGHAALVEFDYQEIAGGGASPSRARFADEFERFVKRLQAAMAYDITQSTLWRTNRVGVVVPSASVYSPAVVNGLCDQISEVGCEPVPISWPKSIDTRFINAADGCDWLVIDIGQDPGSGAVVAFLEARFAPLLRLCHVAPDGDHASLAPVEAALYGAYEVGYPKDIVRWATDEELLREVDSRLARIQQEPRRINSHLEARKYFRSAAPRSETVFISYNGTDAAAAAPIVEAFRRRFQTVFDYKDGQSIRGGRPWIEEIFDSIDRSSLVVFLLSPTYFASQNCVHEAEQAVALRDEGKLQVLPVRLAGRASDMPNWLRRLQLVDYANDPAPVVEQAMALLPEKAQPV